MADYRRMVSYMYQYDKGLKKKNVGYARIEVRNGECKFTLHMQLLGLLDSIFPTYLIQRQDSEMELIYLGDSICKNQVVDSKLTATDKNIMNTGYSLSDMGGMLLFLNDEVFYATEWDDKPVVLNEVLEALRPKDKKRSREELTQDTPESEGEQITSEVLAVSETHREQEEPVSTVSSTKDEETLKVWLPNKEDKVEIKPEESPVEKSPFIDPALDFSNLMDDKEIPVYKLPRGWKTIEILKTREDKQTADVKVVDEPKQVEEVRQVADEPNQVEEIKQVADKLNQVEEISQVADEPDQVEEIKQVADELNQKKPILSAADGKTGYIHNRRTEVNDAREDEEQPLATKIFESYPRIYPFEDNEITMCVKIEPKDIGFLPVDAWVLSNNSFLMHGYYCYNHLIFAKLQDRFGIRYILGVPGIYHNRERFMARMFGFECFKSIRKRELRQGDFGYWYIPITI